MFLSTPIAVEFSRVQFKGGKPSPSPASTRLNPCNFHQHQTNLHDAYEPFHRSYNRPSLKLSFFGLPHNRLPTSPPTLRFLRPTANPPYPGRRSPSLPHPLPHPFHPLRAKTSPLKTLPAPRSRLAPDTPPYPQRSAHVGETSARGSWGSGSIGGGS